MFTGICMISCTEMGTQEVVLDRDAISEEINTLMQSYSGNWNTNADAVIMHYFDSPDFLIFSEGKHWDYAEWSHHVQADFESGYTFEGEPYKDSKIRVLCAEAAIFTSTLDYIMIDSAGAKMQITGGVTYVVVKDGDTWKIMHGIGDIEGTALEE